MGNLVEGKTTLADRLEPQPGYNFAHFRTGHFLADAVRTIRGAGVRPGDAARDFELPATDGPPFHLRNLRGAPVVLHFGSYTCPLTAGGVPPLRELHARYGDRVRFVDASSARPTAAALAVRVLCRGR